MHITLRRINDAVLLEAQNERGNKMQIDGSPDIGGQDLAFRPMELLLTSLAGCASMDVLSILQKQREALRHFEVETAGTRVPEGSVSLFRQIHLHFRFFGEVNPEKAQRAIALSLEKYCSVAKTLEPTASISADFEILP